MVTTADGFAEREAAKAMINDARQATAIRSFLRCLRDYEGQEEPDDAKRYNLLYAPLPGFRMRRFSGFDTHPWAMIEKSQRPLSTAAGAYQITLQTWQERMHGISKNEQFVAFQQDFFLATRVRHQMPFCRLFDPVALIKSST